MIQHAAGGHIDRPARPPVGGEGFGAANLPEPWKTKRVTALVHGALNIRVEITPVPAIGQGYLSTQGAVGENGRRLGNQSRAPQPAQGEEHLLGAVQGEGGNQHTAPGSEGLPDLPGKVLHLSGHRPPRGAVSRLDDDEVSLRDPCRSPQ